MKIEQLYENDYIEELENQFLDDEYQYNLYLQEQLKYADELYINTYEGTFNRIWHDYEYNEFPINNVFDVLPKYDYNSTNTKEAILKGIVEHTNIKDEQYLSEEYDRVVECFNNGTNGCFNYPFNYMEATVYNGTQIWSYGGNRDWNKF